MHVVECEYANVVSQMRTWDLLLFGSPDPVSRAIRCCQRRRLGHGVVDHSHAGVVVRALDLPEGHPCYGPANMVYVFESVLGGRLSDGVGRAGDGETFFGVQLRPLHEVMKAVWAAEGRAVWCPLAAQAGLPDNHRRGAFVKLLVNKYDGTPYDWRPTTLCGALLPCCRPLRWLSRRLCGCCFRTRRLICSQLVAHIYQDLGLVGREVDPRDVVPADFVAHATTCNTKGTLDEDAGIPLLVNYAYRLQRKCATTHMAGSRAPSGHSGHSATSNVTNASMRGLRGDSDHEAEPSPPSHDRNRGTLRTRWSFIGDTPVSKVCPPKRSRSCSNAPSITPTVYANASQCGSYDSRGEAPLGPQQAVCEVWV